MRSEVPPDLRLLDTPQLAELLADVLAQIEARRIGAARIVRELSLRLGEAGALPARSRGTSRAMEPVSGSAVQVNGHAELPETRDVSRERAHRRLPEGARGKRRVFTTKEKLEIVAYAMDHTVPDTCVRFGVGQSMVYKWKKGDQLGQQGIPRAVKSQPCALCSETITWEVLESEAATATARHKAESEHLASAHR